jgi:hypothetical protein
MKVFFISTPRGNNDHTSLIYNTIEELGHKHTTDFHRRLRNENFYSGTDGDWEKRYRNRLREVADAEVCVIEVSQHSLAVGQIVQQAITQEKPTMLLYFTGKRPHYLRGAALAEKRVQLVEYDEMDLKNVLADAFEIAQEMLTTRFTMLLPPEINTFLDSLNKKTGIARSEYIRDLIKKDMKGKK